MYSLLALVHLQFGSGLFFRRLHRKPISSPCSQQYFEGDLVTDSSRCGDVAATTRAVLTAGTVFVRSDSAVPSITAALASAIIYIHSRCEGQVAAAICDGLRLAFETEEADSKCCCAGTELLHEAASFGRLF